MVLPPGLLQQWPLVMVLVISGASPIFAYFSRTGTFSTKCHCFKFLRKTLKGMSNTAQFK